MEEARVRRVELLRIGPEQVMTLTVLTFQDVAHRLNDMVMQKVTGTLSEVLRPMLKGKAAGTPSLRCSVDDMEMNVTFVALRGSRKSVLTRRNEGGYDAMKVHPLTVEVVLSFSKKDTAKRTQSAASLGLTPLESYTTENDDDLTVAVDDDDDLFQDPKRKRTKASAAPTTAPPPPPPAQNKLSRPPAAAPATRPKPATSAPVASPTRAPQSVWSAPPASPVDELANAGQGSSPRRPPGGKPTQPLTMIDEDAVPPRPLKTSDAASGVSSLSASDSSQLGLLTTFGASQDDGADDDLQIVGVLHKDLEAELKRIERDIEDIFRGNLFSWRRDAYVAGGKQRELLKSTHNMLGLSESEIDRLSNILMEKYALRGKSPKHAFVMDVLVPEAIIRILMGRYNLTFDEAEAKMQRPSNVTTKRQRKFLDQHKEVELTEEERSVLRERLLSMAPNLL